LTRSRSRLLCNLMLPIGVPGLAAALLKGKTVEEAVQWGAAHGMLVQETPGDTTIVTEKDVLAEIKRASAGGGVSALR
jgi:2-dehydro-3-deoxygluconokinase